MYLLFKHPGNANYYFQGFPRLIFHVHVSHCHVIISTDSGSLCHPHEMTLGAISHLREPHCSRTPAVANMSCLNRKPRSLEMLQGTY